LPSKNQTLSGRRGYVITATRVPVILGVLAVGLGLQSAACVPTTVTLLLVEQMVHSSVLAG
jgi:hypothetical protein